MTRTASSYAWLRRPNDVLSVLLLCVGVGACSATPDEPAVGHVSQPLSFTPNLPWPSGTTLHVTQGQNGSWSHDGSMYYALDVAVFGCEGTHVLAPADGTIAYAYDDCSCDGCTCNENWGNVVIVDHGNGEFSKYAHLQNNSIPGLGVGSAVCRGDYLGNIGSTGNSTAPHLHLQFQDGGGIHSTSIQFERFVETGGVPAENDVLTSANVEGSGCGAVTGCEVTIELGTTVVDDLTDCFHRVGQYWWEETFGHDGHHWYTFTIDDPQPDSTATWDANVGTAADYTVEVFVPDNSDAVTTQVRYAVRHDGTTDETVVDQAAHRGEWVTLGTYAFAVGGDQHVRIFDDTGEAYVDESGPRLLCDAVRFTSAGGACGDECTDGELQCGGDGWQECGDYDGDPCLEWGGGGPCAAGTHCDGGECVPGDAPDGGTGAGGVGGAGEMPDQGLPGEDEAGCSCRVPDRRRDGLDLPLALAVLGLAAIVQRRRAGGAHPARKG